MLPVPTESGGNKLWRPHFPLSGYLFTVLLVRALRSLIKKTHFPLNAILSRFRLTLSVDDSLHSIAGDGCDHQFLIELTKWIAVNHSL